MKKLRTILTLFMAISTLALAEETTPIEVQFLKESSVPGLELIKVNVTSTADAVTITNVVVNRGNCVRINFPGDLPKPLKFGESFIYRFGSCNPIEIDVTTNLGEWRFKP